MSITDVINSRTPWGTADEVTQIVDGIYWVETPGHGGFYLSEEMNSQVPNSLKQQTFRELGTTGWYEEDCDWAIVVSVFPEHFDATKIAVAKDILKHFF